MLAAIDKQGFPARQMTFGKEQHCLADFLRCRLAPEQVEHMRLVNFVLGLVMAGEDRAGGEAIDPVFRPRGTIALENAIKRQCLDTARLYGLNDRGVLKPGYLADVNVIDLDRIKLGKPWLAFDLPAGGKRLLQKAEGYDYTIKSGQVTFKGGVVTDKRPGGLIRGPQQVERLQAAE